MRPAEFPLCQFGLQNLKQRICRRIEQIIRKRNLDSVDCFQVNINICSYQVFFKPFCPFVHVQFEVTRSDLYKQRLLFKKQILFCINNAFKSKYKVFRQTPRDGRRHKAILLTFNLMLQLIVEQRGITSET